MDSNTLEKHLFDRLIPALTTYHPRPGGGQYHPDDVHRWLRTLADHLTRMSKQGRSGVDLYLHELWRTTGPSTHPGRHVRLQAATLMAGLAALWLAGTWPLSYFAGLSTPSSLDWAVETVTPLGFIGGSFYLSQNRTSHTLRRTDLRLALTPIGRRKLVIWLAWGLYGGLAIGFIISCRFRMAPYAAGMARDQTGQPRKMARDWDRRGARLRAIGWPGSSSGNRSSTG